MISHYSFHNCWKCEDYKKVKPQIIIRLWRFILLKIEWNESKKIIVIFSFGLEKEKNK